MAEKASYDQWIEKIEQILTKANKLPIVEDSFPFPWEEISHKIASRLGLKEFKLLPQSREWHPAGECLSGTGSHPLIIGVELSPLEQSIFWVIPHEAAGDVTSACLASDQQKEKFFDPRLQEGYYQFLMIEVLEIVNSSKIFKDLHPKMILSPTLPQEECLCIDVAISFYPKTIYGKVVIPHSFLNLFKTHQPFEKPTLSKRTSLQHLEFTLRLETGSVTLDAENWKSASPGDYMILDKCSYDPEEKKGSILMYLEGTPILQARIKPDGIKVLDYIFYSEDSPEPAEEEIGDQIEANRPLKIDIEAEHIRMSLEKILEFKPDHMLDVIVRPELGVNMLIKNEHVGKGELIKLGDTIGVRISHKSG